MTIICYTECKIDTDLLENQNGNVEAQNYNIYQNLSHSGPKLHQCLVWRK